MTATYYHFNDAFSYKILELYSRVIGFCGKVRKMLHIRTSHTGVIRRINDRLGSLHLKSEGIKSLVSTFDQQQAIERHEEIIKLLGKYKTFYAFMEEIEFFDNKETESIVESILDNLYDAESIVRKKAFSDKPSDHSDKELLEFASRLSLSSLHS